MAASKKVHRRVIPWSRCFWVLILVFGNSELTHGNDCDGTRFPLLEQNNPIIKCAILLDDDLKFPRNILVIDQDIYVIDKGSDLFTYGERSGAIHRYKREGRLYYRETIIEQLDDPNDIDSHTDDNGQIWIYFTARTGVFRFKASSSLTDIVTEAVLTNLPTNGWHKLVSMHIFSDSLFVHIPSASDHCESSTDINSVHFPCPESSNGTASIRVHTITQGEVNQEFKTIAIGLRSSSGMTAINQGEHLLVSDNGWDNVALETDSLDYQTTPSDELNVIDLESSSSRSPKHYGWPYCYNQNTVSPPYAKYISNCDGYSKPYSELPAHSAPLALISINNTVLVNLHGPGLNGRKTIRLEMDHTRETSNNPKEFIKWVYANNQISRPFGIAALNNKELLFTDDWNHLLIKIILNEKI